jgi:hypothetical protein
MRRLRALRSHLFKKPGQAIAWSGFFCGVERGAFGRSATERFGAWAIYGGAPR